MEGTSWLANWLPFKSQFSLFKLKLMNSYSIFSTLQSPVQSETLEKHNGDQLNGILTYNKLSGF